MGESAGRLFLHLVRGLVISQWLAAAFRLRTLAQDSKGIRDTQLAPMLISKKKKSNRVARVPFIRGKTRYMSLLILRP